MSELALDIASSVNLQNLQSLQNKIVLVTGGTTGIGRATAERFVAAGARVVVTGQDAARLDRARNELPAGVLVLRADARSLDDATMLAETIRERFGRLDAVFLNAGIAKLAPFEHVDEAHFDEQMNVNVRGVVFTLQRLLPLLSRGSSVVVNTSVASSRGAPNMAIYGATKAALASIVRTLAIELAPRGIRVNALAPAPTHTDIQAKFGLPPEMLDAAERTYSARMPLGRFARAGEVADVALFLASDASSFLTGAEIPVDGGLLAT